MSQSNQEAKTSKDKKAELPVDSSAPYLQSKRTSRDSMSEMFDFYWFVKNIVKKHGESIETFLLKAENKYSSRLIRRLLPEDIMSLLSADTNKFLIEKLTGDENLEELFSTPMRREEGIISQAKVLPGDFLIWEDGRDDESTRFFSSKPLIEEKKSSLAQSRSSSPEDLEIKLFRKGEASKIVWSDKNSILSSDRQKIIDYSFSEFVKEFFGQKDQNFEEFLSKDAKSHVSRSLKRLLPDSLEVESKSSVAVPRKKVGRNFSSRQKLLHEIFQDFITLQGDIEINATIYQKILEKLLTIQSPRVAAQSYMELVLNLDNFVNKQGVQDKFLKFFSKKLSLDQIFQNNVLKLAEIIDKSNGFFQSDRSLEELYIIIADFEFLQGLNFEHPDFYRQQFIAYFHSALCERILEKDYSHSVSCALENLQKHQNLKQKDSPEFLEMLSDFFKEFPLGKLEIKPSPTAVEYHDEALKSIVAETLPSITTNFDYDWDEDTREDFLREFLIKKYEKLEKLRVKIKLDQGPVTEFTQRFYLALIVHGCNAFFKQAELFIESDNHQPKDQEELAEVMRKIEGYIRRLEQIPCDNSEFIQYRANFMLEKARIFKKLRKYQYAGSIFEKLPGLYDEIRSAKPELAAWCSTLKKDLIQDKCKEFILVKQKLIFIEEIRKINIFMSLIRIQQQVALFFLEHKMYPQLRLHWHLSRQSLISLLNFLKASQSSDLDGGLLSRVFNFSKDSNHQNLNEGLLTTQLALFSQLRNVDRILGLEVVGRSLSQDVYDQLDSFQLGKAEAKSAVSFFFENDSAEREQLWLEHQKDPIKMLSPEIIDLSFKLFQMSKWFTKELNSQQKEIEISKFLKIRDKTRLPRFLSAQRELQAKHQLPRVKKTEEDLGPRAFFDSLPPVDSNFDEDDAPIALDEKVIRPSIRPGDEKGIPLAFEPATEENTSDNLWFLQPDTQWLKKQRHLNWTYRFGERVDCTMEQYLTLLTEPKKELKSFTLSAPDELEVHEENFFGSADQRNSSLTFSSSRFDHAEPAIEIELGPYSILEGRFIPEQRIYGVYGEKTYCKTRLLTHQALHASEAELNFFSGTENLSKDFITRSKFTIAQLIRRGGLTNKGLKYELEYPFRKFREKLRTLFLDIQRIKLNLSIASSIDKMEFNCNKLVGDSRFFDTIQVYNKNKQLFSQQGGTLKWRHLHFKNKEYMPVNILLITTVVMKETTSEGEGWKFSYNFKLDINLFELIESLYPAGKTSLELATIFTDEYSVPPPEGMRTKAEAHLWLRNVIGKMFIESTHIAEEQPKLPVEPSPEKPGLIRTLKDKVERSARQEVSAMAAGGRFPSWAVNELKRKPKRSAVTSSSTRGFDLFDGLASLGSQAHKVVVNPMAESAPIQISRRAMANHIFNEAYKFSDHPQLIEVPLLEKARPEEVFKLTTTSATSSILKTSPRASGQKSKKSVSIFFGRQTRVFDGEKNTDKFENLKTRLPIS